MLYCMRGQIVFDAAGGIGLGPETTWSGCA